MSVVSKHTLLLAAALLGAAAGARAQQPTSVKFTVEGRPAGASSVTKPEYRVTREKDATVVSLFAGQKPTGGYSITVTRVDQQDGACTVRYRIQGPPPDAIVTQMLTYPAVTIRIAAACKDVKVDPPMPRSGATQ